MRRRKRYVDNAVNSKNVRNRNTLYMAIVLLALVVTMMLVNQKAAKMKNIGNMAETQDVREAGMVQDGVLAQDTLQGQHGYA